MEAQRVEPDSAHVDKVTVVDTLPGCHATLYTKQSKKNLTFLLPR